MRYRPIEERFAEKYVVDTETGCWNWTAMKVTGGYGMIGLPRGAGMVLAHRFSYEHHVGPVPDGQIVRHSCHNPSCVNPEHLYPGTHEDNMADMAEAGRRIGRNAGTALSGQELIRLKGLLTRGWTQLGAADALGVHRSTVQRALYRGEVALRTERAKKPQRVYLTDEQRAEAIRMLESGARVMAIAKRFGVDRKTIRNMRPGHIPPPPRGRPRGK